MLVGIFVQFTVLISNPEIICGARKDFFTTNNIQYNISNQETSNYDPVLEKEKLYLSSIDARKLLYRENGYTLLFYKNLLTKFERFL